MATEAAPALKEMYDPAFYRRLASLLANASPPFDRKHFLRLTTVDLPPLSLNARMRRTSEACRATLPQDFRAAVTILRAIAPDVPRGYVGIFLPDFVGRYGAEFFDESMSALAYFTRFSSSEFAIREFLRRDLERTLTVMQGWARADDEHLRRLASEGSRPRLPWSFRLTAIVQKPALTLPILTALNADPSLYVRKSVANHLNDISKDHPDWMLKQLAKWDLSVRHTAWIARHAARSLIKSGHPESFRLFGFTRQPAVRITACTVQPTRLKLGGKVELAFTVKSEADAAQRLAIDYVVHYQKKSGRLGPKVFKLKELTLRARDTVRLVKHQRIVDFTTRVHHPGRHVVDVMVNGERRATREFELTR